MGAWFSTESGGRTQIKEIANFDFRDELYCPQRCPQFWSKCPQENNKARH